MRQKRYSRYGGALLLFLLLIVVVYCYSSADSVGEAQNDDQIIPIGADAFTLSDAKPKKLIIPKINVEAPFTEPLGLETNREVEVPEGYDEVGWYKYSPTPGELGPSVILGHVDSVDGPGVFYALGQLEIDDRFEIEREDGSNAVFKVTEIGRYEQSGFPTELVYGNIDHAGIRLITCSGTFDKGIQRYSHNLVVYGELLSPPETIDL